MSRLAFGRALDRCAGIGLVVFVGAAAAEHVLASSLDPASHMLSEYANHKTGPVMTAGFLAWAASLAATAIYAWIEERARALALLMGLAALGIVLVACFATQTSAGVLPPGTQWTTTGRLHDLGSGAASLALLAAAIVSTVAAWVPRSFRLRTTMLIALALTGSAALLTIGPEVGGLRQRLLVLVACGWQLLLLATLRSRRRSRRSP